VEPVARLPRRRRPGTTRRVGALAVVLALPLASSLGAACAGAPAPRGQRARVEAQPTGPAPTIVLLGGRVHTFDATRPAASAVAIAGAEILAVGDDAAIEALAGPDTRRVELGGRTVVPGLIDAHFHLFGVGASASSLSLVGTRSIDDVKARVAKAVKAAAPGAWIVGRGWDQNDWGTGARFPTAKALDEVAGDHPIVLHRVDGHALWANSAAMRAAGVGPNTVDPPGGRVIREGRAPSGVFVDNAMALVEGAIPPPTPSELRKAVFLGEREALRNGLTEIHEMGLGKAELDVLLALDAAGELKLRIYAMVDGSAEDLGQLFAYGPRVPEPTARARVTIRGVKFYLDGALGSRGAALLAPYADDASTSGLLLMDPALYEARVRTAHARGFQVATHAIGDRANRLALDVYERVFGQGLWRARPRIEHAQVFAPADLPRVGGLGVVASMQPLHATSDGPWAARRLGRERMAGAYAWRALLATSATIAAGSDAPVERPSAIDGLVAAIFRQDPEALGTTPETKVERTASGRISIVDDGLVDVPTYGAEQRVTPQEALRAFTRGAAFASFREKVVGMIEPGRVADLTVLTADPLTADANALARARVDFTIVGGELAFVRAGADRPMPRPSAKAAEAPATTEAKRGEPAATTTTTTTRTATTAR
jgi:predicted amidohydrolase YtcJ